MASKVSVVMSVYNEPQHFVKKAVDSILSQTFEDFEFIIVCDNPKNTSLYQYLMSVKDSDKRVKIIKNEVNIGLTKSLNKAIANSEGIYIARMDADRTESFACGKEELPLHGNAFLLSSSGNDAKK